MSKKRRTIKSSGLVGNIPIERIREAVMSVKYDNFCKECRAMKKPVPTYEQYLKIAKTK